MTQDEHAPWPPRSHGAGGSGAGARGPADAGVRARLQAEGRLTFAAFMEEALYGPDGYYTGRPRLGGAGADFFTSPELHPVFGALLGRLVAGVWEQLGRPPRFDVVEYGPGTGALCCDLLTWADHALPAFASAIRYVLVERSPVLRMVQRQTLLASGLDDGRVAWGADQPSTPTGSVHGVILANELVDALPVHLVIMCRGQLSERYVVLLADGDLGWHDDAPSTPALAAYFERLGVWPGEGCIAEVNVQGVTWQERVASTLGMGALLVLDYGYPAADLYSPGRRFGTLLTYRAHSLGSDPLRHVGGQDITAHVDFTSLARAGERSGLETVGLISQASLLRRLGLERYLRQLDRSDVSATVHDVNRRAMQALAEPSGLGRIQALVQTRGLRQFDPFADVAGEEVASPGDALHGWLPLISRPGQMQLLGPLEAEGFVDLEEQWRELLAGDDGDTL